MSFGLPYKGSKSAIAKDIIAALPEGNRLVDLFCGGCAITDYAMKKTGKFNRFLINDIDERNPKTYMRALNGGFRNEDRWISRQDFFKIKETDDYARLCFSFGNNGKTYMYGQQIEPYKRAIHHIVFWEDYAPMEELCPAVVKIIHDYCDGKDQKGRRLALGHAVAAHVKAMGSVEYWQSNPMFRAVKVKWSEDRRGMSSAQWNRGSPLESLECLERMKRLESPESLQSLQSLERLQSLESLESLKSLESLQSLERLQSLEIRKSLQSLQSLESLERLESLQSLESLERLESLQSLESLERLERLENQNVQIVASSDDYRNYVYQDDDVFYCDPPYANTDKYTVDFDHEAFWQWCRTRNFPVYISEYRAPEDFISVWSKEKRRLFSSSNLSANAIEHLFLHKKWI